ncbi:Leishmanolysin [Hondaea fermentalgiana]|uniref:Leishmanolysin n=1 Tax=Hondaea fermentalgiana TaxID=2315210 RepID=A0A2R5GPQ1_9STRA|nr:Leishmanolysin [Hondaea fermentalgiana]|eukprot:GBG32852.1 Leishmanolysin [Hondaea fermentalgiana]
MKTPKALQACVENVYTEMTYVAPAIVGVFVDKDLSAATAPSSDVYTDVILFQMTFGKRCTSASVLVVTKTDAFWSDSAVGLPAANETQEDDLIQLHLDIENDDVGITGVFERVVSYWNAILRGSPMPKYARPSDLALASCGILDEPFDDVNQGLKVFATVKSIDGEGGGLGYAGVCLTLDGQPVTGVMVLDQADLASLNEDGLLEHTIMHEIGHILGFGTIWTKQVKKLSSDHPLFKGKNARKAYKRLGGKGKFVPVEGQGGSGTAGGHWDEAVFEGELMTGWLSGRARLSSVTLGALKDLGYQVNEDFAADYTLPSTVEQLKRRNTARETVHNFTNDILPYDYAVDIDSSGNVVGTIELQAHASRMAMAQETTTENNDDDGDDEEEDEGEEEDAGSSR